MEYEPDSEVTFNYMMASALAEATNQLESKAIPPTEGSSFALNVVYT